MWEITELRGWFFSPEDLATAICNPQIGKSKSSAFAFMGERRRIVSTLAPPASSENVSHNPTGDFLAPDTAKSSPNPIQTGEVPSHGTF